MMNDIFCNSTETETVEEIKTVTEKTREIVLYNDDFNTFDFVIETLVEVCGHERTQAEQCTFLVHYKGKCSVKKGDYDTLKPICTALLNRGLTAEIS